MLTPRKIIERLAVLAVLAPAPAAAQGTSADGQPPVQAGGLVLAEGSLNSVHKLLKIAYPVARQWSPGAKLYSMYGRAPRNEKRWESEQWGLIFGDPKTKDGSFHIIFQDGVVKIRQGIKGGVRMVDEFKNGQFQSRETDFAQDYSNTDYSCCKPIDPNFADTRALEKLIWKNKLPSNSLGQYNFSLLRPLNDQCDGLGRHSLFLSDKPIPRRLMKRSLWVIHTPMEVVYVDARGGKIVFRRPALTQ